MYRTGQWIALFAFLGGCSAAASEGAPGSTSVGATANPKPGASAGPAAAPGSSSGATSGGSTPAQPAAGQPTDMMGTAGSGATPAVEPGPQGDCDMLSLEKSHEVAVGKTLTLCAGATIKAAAGAQLIVRGTLVTNGTAAQPVTIDGTTGAIGSWGGLVVMSGGNAKLNYTTLLSATMPVDAQAGSVFAFDHMVIKNSTMLMKIASSGSITNSTITGTGMTALAAPITITAASPTFTDVLMEKGGPLADMVDVYDAKSTPVFDHVDISGVHCAIHMNQATNTVIKNSYLHDVAYGVMVLASTGTKVEHNNFKTNQNHVGLCLGGTATLSDNSFDKAPFDSSCTAIVNGTPAAAPFTDVGVR